MLRFDSVVLWWFPDGALCGCLFWCCLLVVIGSINSVVRDTHSGVILVVLWFDVLVCIWSGCKFVGFGDLGFVGFACVGFRYC